MWQKPWGYKEGFSICGGLFIVGILLQITLGKTQLDLLVWPMNAILGGVYILLLMLMQIFRRKSYLLRWLSSYPAAITSIASVVVMTLIMGFTRQIQAEVQLTGIERWLGFSQMLSSWSFALLLVWFITLLGLSTLKRLSHFQWRDIPFHLNHFGLFLALFGAILGSPDLQRLKMTTVMNKAEWRAFDENNRIVELPLAIELHDFTIDEYPPKLMLLDNETGQALPQGRPRHLLLEEEVNTGKLCDWDITIEKRIPMAASVATADTTKFVEFHSRGATYAAYVKARNVNTSQTHEGWVSCGSFMFPYKAIRLDEATSLVMPEREPRRFASEVTVYTQSEKKVSATIEVNKPMKIDGWKIYQLSYDETKGRWSDTSVFELVRDPWIPVVYTGIWMMIAGAVCMFTITQNRKEDRE